MTLDLCDDLETAILARGPGPDRTAIRQLWLAALLDDLCFSVGCERDHRNRNKRGLSGKAGFERVTKRYRDGGSPGTISRRALRSVGNFSNA